MMVAGAPGRLPLVLLLALALALRCSDAAWPAQQLQTGSPLQQRIARTVFVAYKPGATEDAVAQVRARMASGALGARLSPPLGGGGGGGSDTAAPQQIGDMAFDVFESQAITAKGPQAAILQALERLLSQQGQGAEAPPPPQQQQQQQQLAAAAAGGGAALSAVLSEAAAANGLPPDALGPLDSEARAILAAGGGAVALVSRDAVFRTQQVNGQSTVTQASPGVPWGLDRIDQQSGRAPDGRYTYYSTAGEGTYVYVIDTGVQMDHPELAGRVIFLGDLIGEGLFDGVGHGTHVSGTIAGTNVGVAKKATLVALKVCDKEGECSGSAIISAISRAVSDCRARPFPPGSARRCVMNLSLGGDAIWSPLDRAVDGAVSAGGMVVAVAAGNSRRDACGSSPGASELALVVAASNERDSRAPFSNKGPCVDVFAPGSKVYSSFPGGLYKAWSGTSMASPHVAGAAALIWSAYPSASAADVIAAIKAKATLKAVRGAVAGAPRALLYTLISP